MSENHTENEILRDAVLAAAMPTELIEGRVWSRVLPSGDHELIELDPEAYIPHPLRKRGQATLFEVDSLVAYVNAHKSARTGVYANVDAGAVVAVLDGHEPGPDGIGIGLAGWHEHVATLRLRHTPDWDHWAKLDGKRVSQEAFAEHLEDGVSAITDPPAAEMLEIAQTLHVSRQASFRSGNRLTDGRRQFSYVEDQQGTAGERGQLDIPETFGLLLQPYEGSDVYPITARLRYRLDDGHLSIGYKLDRPDQVLRQAFTDICGRIHEQTDITPLMGLPPA